MKKEFLVLTFDNIILGALYANNYQDAEFKAGRKYGRQIIVRMTQ
ncbi:hypothetical protein UFOVP1655_149 [uncultured Caudovirales phage]|uniref:Uncharacterized protein n=1 Tax=uncultured Caudovirales phage TaxID=2100421 RepID=A0A6J5T490_9CAUD|nr:hypothetical protein UFOVP1655_149 [uncultured Caudovirales phage]